MHAACTTTAPTPPSGLPAGTSPPASYGLLATRQQASAFNQPLSFDTSSVTNMYWMFFVRSTRALAPSFQLGHPRACRLHHHRTNTPL